MVCPIEDPEQLIKLNLGELEMIMELMLGQEIIEKEYEEQIKQIREGIRIKIPIIYITNGWYQDYPSAKRTIVQGFGKYKLEPFHKEVKAREQLLRRIIMENLEDEDPTEPRAKSL